MKIGQIVQNNIPAIFAYCEAHDLGEFARLQNVTYSKVNFDINYPFCTPVSKISPDDHVRYWKRIYTVHGFAVRVTSQWFNPPTSQSLPRLRAYLAAHRIPFVEFPLETDAITTEQAPERAPKGRYKGHAIGNAQNLFVRNILSRLGQETFNAAQWHDVITEFGDCCAYCGSTENLVIDHAIAINKLTLGEHRLGNLVPACHRCNSEKADQDFRDFIAEDPARIAAIEAHMAKHGYVPLGTDAEISKIIALGHQEVRDLAERYVSIIDAVLEARLSASADEA
ncbi:HNH endonuclease [Rhodobacter aestuarii]|uniref:HNH endonuclease n=1 Tax=Rhodobacter aestuarii TaxID=453582 RepID=A0A1N7P794_9RHOB|nr:HNH endonuclease [Rhodobacter aestuarii]SIT06525.1 HNH endonuclease [Rhodobacter aestuarii]